MLDADLFGQEFCKLTNYEVLAVSTPQATATSIHRSVIDSIRANLKFSEFKKVTDIIENSLYFSIKENKEYPDNLSKSNLKKIEELSKNISKESPIGCFKSSGKEFLVYVVYVDKNVRCIQGKRGLSENEIRDSIYEIHKEDAIKFVESEIKKIPSKPFDASCTVAYI